MAGAAKDSDGFSSHWGLVLASLGAAIGTGNIWRFPIRAAANGGGAFLIPLFIFIFSWCIPLLIAEFTIGKKTRLGTVGAFKKLMGKNYPWMGIWMMMVSLIVGFYYAVVMGWTINYSWVAITGGISGGVDGLTVWNSFLGSYYQVLLFQGFAVFISCYIVYRGIAKGIERTNLILMPILFGMLIFLVIWVLGTLPRSVNGLHHLFVPNLSDLSDAKLWMDAMGQAVFSTSAGFGMAITYGAVMKKNEDTALNPFLVGLGDTGVALLAGVVVFGAVFGIAGSNSEALGALSGADVPAIGFPFIYLTELFGTIPGGAIFGFIFFLAMAFAALTSMIATLEIAARNFIDCGWNRVKAIKWIGLLTFIGGIPSAVLIERKISNRGEFYNPWFMEVQMDTWDVGLVIAGLFVAIAVYRYGVTDFRMNLINTPDNDIHIGKWWEVVMVYLFPLQFVILITWMLYETFSTLLVIQILALFLFVILANNWLGRLAPPFDDDDEEEDEPEPIRAKTIGSSLKGLFGTKKVLSQESQVEEKVKGPEYPSADVVSSKTRVQEATILDTKLGKEELVKKEIPPADIIEKEIPKASVIKKEHPKAEVMPKEVPKADVIKKEPPPKAEVLQVGYPKADMIVTKPPEADILEEGSPKADVLKRKPPEADIVHEGYPKADVLKGRPPPAEVVKKEIPSAEIVKTIPPKAEILRTDYPDASTVSRSSATRPLQDHYPAAGIVHKDVPPARLVKKGK